MTQTIHAVKIGAGALPVTTAPLAISSAWAVAVYTPPPLDTPTGLAGLSISDASVLNWIPTPGCQTVIETAPNNNDATPGAWTVRTQTADDTYTMPIPAGTVRWVRIKAVKNGRSSGYSSPVLVAPLIFGAGPGKNLIGNPSFEVNTITDTGVAKRTGDLCNLWTAMQSAAASSYCKRVTGDGNTTGDFAMEVQLAGQSLANAAYLFSDYAQYGVNVPALSGQVVAVRASLKVSGSGSLQSCDMATSVAVLFYNTAGGYLGAVSAVQYAQSYTGKIYAKGVVPTGTARCIAIVQGYVFNNTGSTKALSGEMFRMRVDDIEVQVLANMDEDIVDGMTHGRIAMQDIHQTGGVNRLGVAVATSGQQITARNIPSTLSASGGSLWDGLTIDTEFTAATPAVVTVTVGAATLRASGYSPAYAAAAATVNQTRGTTVRYYAYYDDPTLAGGTKTLVLSTARLDTVNAAGRVFISTFTVTVPASGTGTGTGDRNGGGGGGYIP